MMRSSVRLVLAVLAVLLTCVALGGCRHDSGIGDATAFEVHDAWVRAVPDSGATTAAYMRLVNGSGGDVVVSRFSSDDARVVELHQSSVVGGEASMTMRDSLAVAQDHSVTMRPGGYHLMLIGTTHPFVPGTLIRIVMHLSNGAIISTSARVRS